MGIGFGAMMSCVSVMTLALGDVPDEGQNPLGKIDSIFVSDRMCLVKDWGPSISFTFMWAAVAVKLRRTYVSVVKNATRGANNQTRLSESALLFMLFVCVGVQVAIKVMYMRVDPPKLGQKLPVDIFTNATNPNFYCYSASSSKFQFLDTTWHVLLLIVVVMFAWLNRDIVKHDVDDFVSSKKASKSDATKKLLNETHNVLSAAYTVLLLMMLTEFMQPYMFEDWKSTTLLL